MPSKSCVRSFSPSTTLTCTRTVSPGTNACRSFLSCPASTKRMASMTSFPLLLRAPAESFGQLRPLPAFESLDEPLLVGRQIHILQELGSCSPREPERLHAPSPRGGSGASRPPAPPRPSG